MKIVVQHYESYISNLSIRKFCDEHGNCYFGIDRIYGIGYGQSLCLLSYLLGCKISHDNEILKLFFDKESTEDNTVAV